LTRPPLVTRNSEGYRIGEGHHNCTIPEAVVVRARDLHEGLEPSPIGSNRLGPVRIAAILGLPVETTRKIIYYRRRQHVMDPERSG
jgi:hypothetical protein